MIKAGRTIKVSKELLEASKGLLTLGVVTAKVEVSKINQDLWDLLKMSGATQKQNYSESKIEDIPPIKALRDTYKTLGLKVSDYKGSNEALLKRVITDKGVYQINTIVDINNYISVESLRSVGSYDLSKLSGDIVFRKGESGESYVGTTNRPVQLKNLPILSDDQGAFGSPTSDSKRALIQESTTEVMTVIFSFDGDKDLKDQVNAISNMFKKYVNASNVVTYLVQDKPEALILESEMIDKNIEVIEKFKDIEITDKKIKEDDDYGDTAKTYKENLSGFKLINSNDKDSATCIVNFSKKLTGEMHFDALNLNTVEYVVNLLKHLKIIKNEQTKVIGDKSLNFAYEGVELKCKSTTEQGNILLNKELPSLSIKLCDDHFELLLSITEDNLDSTQCMGELIETLENHFL